MHALLPRDGNEQNNSDSTKDPARSKTRSGLDLTDNPTNDSKSENDSTNRRIDAAPTKIAAHHERTGLREEEKFPNHALLN